MNFRNITQLPSGSWQLKLKKDGVEAQPVLPSLCSAIKVRNSVYIGTGYRPPHLYVKTYDMTVVADRIGLHKSGAPYHHYQVHSRRLTDRKYMPKTFSSKTAAYAFAEWWIEKHNAIANVYNGWREQCFVKAIDDELQTLTPCINGKFDVTLWQKAAEYVFGNNVPAITSFHIELTQSHA